MMIVCIIQFLHSTHWWCWWYPSRLVKRTPVHPALVQWSTILRSVTALETDLTTLDAEYNTLSDYFADGERTDYGPELLVHTLLNDPLTWGDFQTTKVHGLQRGWEMYLGLHSAFILCTLVVDGGLASFHGYTCIHNVIYTTCNLPKKVICIADVEVGQAIRRKNEGICFHVPWMQILWSQKQIYDDPPMLW